MKAVLGISNLTGKHAHWWSKLCGCGISEIDIVNCTGKHNCHADALFHQPTLPAPTEEQSELEVQVAKIAATELLVAFGELLEQQPIKFSLEDLDTLSSQKLVDPDLYSIIAYLNE